MNKCCICNTLIDNKYEQCLDCNYKIINFMNYDMNCHLKPKQIIKSYENKITEIVKTENFNDKQTKCIELIGLARFLAEEYDNELLEIDVYNDVRNLLENKEQKQNQQTLKNNLIEEKIDNEEILDFRLKFPMKFHCIDGHYVRSPYEQQIDDFLTEQNIIHYYEKRVKDYDTNETYYPDWYLPNITKNGIYIEFFGVNEENYKEKTERKLKFFKKQNLNLIVLYQKHINNYREYIIDKIEEFKKKD